MKAPAPSAASRSSHGSHFLSDSGWATRIRGGCWTPTGFGVADAGAEGTAPLGSVAALSAGGVGAGDCAWDVSAACGAAFGTDWLDGCAPPEASVGAASAVP